MSLSRVGVSALRGVRNSSSGTNVYSGYAKLNPVKENYTIEDGSPIFKRGGTFDRILYGVTAAACAAAVGFNLKLYYDFSLK